MATPGFRHPCRGGRRRPEVKGRPMKVLVAVKRVVDANFRIRVKRDGSGVELDNVKMAMNPFDEIAVEEAIRLKEKGIATEIVAVSVGAGQGRGHAAPGARDGRRPRDPRPARGPHGIARRRQGAEGARRVAKAPSLVLLGKQAIDDDANQTGQMLAALMGCGQATFASEPRDRRHDAPRHPRGRWRPPRRRARPPRCRHRRPAAQHAALCPASQRS